MIAAPTVPLHLLLAEDNPINQKVAVALIERIGHSVDVVTSGTAAVEQLQRQRYDAVLMDINMPDMDGVAATQAIRALSGPVARIPIFALTADASADRAQQCLAAGVDTVLHKPVRLTDLARLINTVVDAENDPGRPDSGGDADGLDPNALADLRRSVDPSAIDALVADARRDIDSNLAALAEAVDRADPAEAARAAHTIRSVSATFSLTALAAEAGRIEQAGLAGRRIAPAAVGKVGDLAQRSFAHLLNRLANRDRGS